jgi:hypothetical protein
VSLVPVGKMLIGVGVVMILVGAIMLITPRFPFLGRLPGDIVIERRSFSLYAPIVTCLIVSAVLSFILWLLTRK